MSFDLNMAASTYSAAICTPQQVEEITDNSLQRLPISVWRGKEASELCPRGRVRSVIQASVLSPYQVLMGNCVDLIDFPDVGFSGDEGSGGEDIGDEDDDEDNDL